jgi:L-asparaginase II
MPQDALVEVLRGKQIESCHHVSFAIVDAMGELVASWGDPELVTFMRSSAKPFQAIACIEGGAADHFRFDSRDLALVCASHSGTEMHVESVRRLLEKIGLSEDALQCGVHVPYDEGTFENLLRSGGVLEPIRNNCSGKHAGMLALAKHLDAKLDSYLEPAHPVQHRILETLAEMTGVAADSIVVGVDGCSAPTFAVPLYAAARGYARLVDRVGFEDRRVEACSRIVQAMTEHPELVAGPGRFDTLFMQAVNGRMVSKSGAEGFQSIGIPGDGIKDGSPPLGIAIKVHDGDHPSHRAAALTAIEIVDRLGGFWEGEKSQLADFDTRETFNLRGITVGEIRISPSFRREFKQKNEWL